MNICEGEWRGAIAKEILSLLRVQDDMDAATELVIWGALVAGNKHMKLFKEVILGFCEAVKKHEE